MTRLVQTLLSRANTEAERLAIVAGDQVLSWGELGRRVRAAARKLFTDGVRAGERVVLAASTSPAFICGYFATHLLGAIALPVDPRMPAARLAHIVQRVDPAGIFLGREIDLGGHRIRDIEALGRADGPDDGWTSPEALPDDPEQTADILFTSGTTGSPKGVVLSHRAICAAARNVNAFVGNGAGDREIMPLPLSHSFGLGRLRCAVLAGGALILADGFTAAGKLFEAMRRWSATGFSAVPAGFGVLFKTTGDTLGEFAGTLRWIEIGSAAMPAADKRRLMRLLPETRICMHYGLTEASRSAFVEFHTAGERLESIGRASPGVEIRIVDEAGSDVPVGQRGRLVVRGETLLREYWRDGALTTAAFVDGWLISGDLGRRDADGYLYLEAREKDMINVGGREVSPVEIERILAEHPAVAECACAGVPDPQGITGHAVKAFLVAAEGVEVPPTPIELARLLRGRIEPYKMPVAFEWIEALPKTDSGKIQRSRLVARG